MVRLLSKAHHAWTKSCLKHESGPPQSRFRPTQEHALRAARMLCNGLKGFGDNYVTENEPDSAPCTPESRGKQHAGMPGMGCRSRSTARNPCSTTRCHNGGHAQRECPLSRNRHGLSDRGPMGRQDRTQAFPADQRCYTESIGVNDVVVLQQVRDLVRSRFDCFHVSTGREPSGITTHRLKRNRPAECCGGVDF
jgi:hypothetical protein